MDLSKLPRLSQTPAPPPGTSPDAPPEPPVPRSEAQGFPVTPVGSPPVQGVPLFCRCGAQLPPGTRFCSNCGASFAEATGVRRAEPIGGMWIEAFMSVAVGLFLLFMVPATVKYYGHRWFGLNTGPFVDPFTNQPVDYATYTDGSRKLYRDLPNYWNDVAVTAFALVLILEGIVFAVVRNRWVILGTAVLTAIVTVGNLIYLVSTFSTMGFAPISALAVIFGILMAGYQFRMFFELRR
jgi:hypothetical protein